MGALAVVLGVLNLVLSVWASWVLIDRRWIAHGLDEAPTPPEPVAPAAAVVALDWPDRGMIRHDRAA